MSSIGQAIQSVISDDDTGTSHFRRPRPRPRPVLSCLRCRRRKIKCDRALPCEVDTRSPQTLQSNNVGRPSTNASPIHLEESRQHPSIPVHNKSEVTLKGETLASLQERLQKLERLCETHSSAPVTTSDQKDGEKRGDNTPKADAPLSIKASGPRYHSQSYKKLVHHHFGVANRFAHSGFDDPERAPVMNELRMYHDKFTKARKKRNCEKPTRSSLPSILELLPSRVVCDEYVSTYFKSFEKCMRILHFPSFMDECQRFWASEESLRQRFNSLAPQLAVIVATIHAWEDGSASRDEKAIKPDVLCDSVEAWLDNLAGRRQLTMATLRTRALLILAQQVRAIQADEIWKATGKLLRSAMTAGLHRDPSEFSEISIFEGELRRRLWMTIVEMDLEASLIYGMPIMIRDYDFTCNTPSNVDDLELFESMTELPLSKPLAESTNSTFQIALVGSVTLRLQALGEPITRIENLQARINALEAYILGLPSNLHLDGGRNVDFEQRFGIVLLNVLIRRVMSFLYRSSTPLTLEAITPGLQSSLSILSYQKLFDPEILEPDKGKLGRYWDLFHILCKSDIMQAALDVCLHLQTRGLVSWTKASLLLAIDDTTANLMRRISRNGCDIKDIHRLSIISQLLKSQFMKQNSNEMMKEGSYNVLMACRRATGQEGPFTGEERNAKVDS
ncbi:hypothetical protein B7494_g1582 [Chlorociboria aeruginascens]|nr:hypothetical protein B7494_g1582 [Chlorociboria aeruginascens]